MKPYFAMNLKLRKITSAVLIAIMFLTTVCFPCNRQAEADGVLPIALPDGGIYDSYREVTLFSEAGAVINYSIGPRASTPATLYNAGQKILIEEDVVLSVDSTINGVTAHKDFTYVINPYISSISPSNGAQNVSRTPTIKVVFSREMEQSAVVNEDNISIYESASGGALELGNDDFNVSYTSSNNTLSIAVTSQLDAGTDYTVSFANFVDSNGKALLGDNSFTFRTVADQGFPTYGTVTTNSTFYDNVAPQDSVVISGIFVKNGQEVTDGNLDPPLQLRIYDPDGILVKIKDVGNLNAGRFSATYLLPNGCKVGDWKIDLYDDSNPRQLLDSCYFTVGTVAAPVADKDSTLIYYEPITINLTTSTSGASIYYTTNNSIADEDVNESCTLYQGPITISSTTTIRARAIKGGVKSGLLTKTYIINNEFGILTFDPERTTPHPENVSVYASISVTFGRAANSTTINANTFQLVELESDHDYTGIFVTGTVTYDAVNRKATFKPANPLKPNTHYRGILSTNIKDLNGNGLPAINDWIFETAVGQSVTVDGKDVVGDYITVNKNIVEVRVNDPDASMVTINGKPATSVGGNQFKLDVTLKPGKNTVTIQVTDTQAVSYTTTITINYLNLLQVGAEAIAAIPEKGKLELFNKQLTIVFPTGAYLYDANGPLADQSLVFRVYQNTMPDGYPSVSPMFEIEPKTVGAQLNNKGEATLTLTIDKYVSTSSASTLTVLCDPDDDGIWEENLGGKVDAKKRTVTVPFGYFGKYVVVNKVWAFTDYATTGWARAYVEYLWSKGIMKELPNAGAGRFGLTDSQGQEIPITRGEFAVMMGKALGINKIDYTEYGIFADMRLSGSIGLARDRDGYWDIIDDDDYKYIDLLARNGIINGSLDRYNNLVFNYFDNITREEVAVILVRALNLAVETDDAKVKKAITKLFTDADTSISEWAQPYVLAASKGYFGGNPDRTFRGQDSFTRPQAARIVYQIMKKAKLM